MTILKLIRVSGNQPNVCEAMNILDSLSFLDGRSQIQDAFGCHYGCRCECVSTSITPETALLMEIRLNILKGWGKILMTRFWQTALVGCALMILGLVVTPLDSAWADRGAEAVRVGKSKPKAKRKKQTRKKKKASKRKDAKTSSKGSKTKSKGTGSSKRPKKKGGVKGGIQGGFQKKGTAKSPQSKKSRAKKKKRSRPRLLASRKKRGDGLDDCSNKSLKRMASNYLRKGTIKPTGLISKGKSIEMKLNGKKASKFAGRTAVFVKPYGLKEETVHVILKSRRANDKVRVYACEYGYGRPVFNGRLRREKVFSMDSGVTLNLSGGRKRDVRMLPMDVFGKIKSRVTILVVEPGAATAALELEVLSDTELRKRAAEKKAIEVAEAARERARKKAEAERREAERRADEARQAQAKINRDVIEMAEYLDRKYYDNFSWVDGTRGVSESLKVTSKEGRMTILSADQYSRQNRSTYCVSFVLQAVVRVLEQRGRFKSLTKKEVKTFQQIFYGWEGIKVQSPVGTPYTEVQIREGQSQLALRHFKMGDGVALEDARPGDLIFKSDGEDTGAGHQFLFDSWLTTSSGDRIGMVGYGAHYGVHTGGVRRKPFCFKLDPDQQSDEQRQLCRNTYFTLPGNFRVSRLSP